MMERYTFKSIVEKDYVLNILRPKLGTWFIDDKIEHNGEAVRFIGNTKENMILWSMINGATTVYRDLY